jgi:sulfonate transport system substrate-binding protein
MRRRHRHRGTETDVRPSCEVRVSTRKFRPKTLAAWLFAAAMLLLTSCGGQPGRVTLRLGDQVKGMQTLMEAAGVLDNTPYDFEWAQFQGAAPMFEAVKAGSLDTANAADLPTLQAISGGVPIKGVAAQHSDGRSTAILTQPDSSVRSVADLRGREVVVSSAKGSIAEYLLTTALAQAGLSYSDVKVRYLLPTDAQAAFRTGKLDVWATFGVYQAIAQEKGARTLVDGTQRRTSGIGFLSAADPALANPAKRQAVGDFAQRYRRAVEWAQAHPEEYARAYAKEHSVPEPLARTMVAWSTKSVGPVDPEVQKDVQRVADTMNSIGIFPKPVDVAAGSDAGVLAAPK